MNAPGRTTAKPEGRSPGKPRAARPAISTLSACLLLIAMAGALLGLVRTHPQVRSIADWTCGIAVIALAASLVHDARKPRR